MLIPVTVRPSVTSALTRLPANNGLKNKPYTETKINILSRAAQ